MPYDSLELALIEAWTAGGNYILAMEPHYREALLSNDPKATAAWKQLGKTARWLRENITLFRQPSFPIVTALVDDRRGQRPKSPIFCTGATLLLPWHP